MLVLTQNTTMTVGAMLRVVPTPDNLQHMLRLPVLQCET